ncbi:S-adenosylmethionine:tRNA ribosyltransferase-isomerase [Pectobacterium aroidearum]|uniref:S-adenosylmethionine:tRNA ribosyltransferase-isomerase n=1 Tax=Pectobacterium aroidearum TaxID=1201031 RepID=UPI0032EAB46C
MKTQEFDFAFDPSSMPSLPSEFRGRNRDSGGMVVLDRNNSKIEHVDFTDIYNYLRSGDLLVVTNPTALSPPSVLHEAV